ncbi:MAG TPA: amidohydrolase family protein [Flavitalea sp.]|nr:amidohydrolase family protein [Flavitalea sp.]
MRFILSMVCFLLAIDVTAQNDSFYLFKPSRVFDGDAMHSDWVVLVHGNSIEAAGPMQFKLPANTRVIELTGATLMPGMIEGHSHLFLHPYNEVTWNNQVVTESRAERTARAVMHARATLMAGFTMVRDLGTEGAAFDDVGLKHAIEKGIIEGPRIIVATKAIVARGSYGPNLHNADLDLPQGAAEISGPEEMAKEVRDEISNGADLIKLYADYRWGAGGTTSPTLTLSEIQIATDIATNGGRVTVAHAASRQGMRNAILGGVKTIEHGDEGDEAIFMLMKEKQVAFFATLAAGEAYAEYAGWKKGTDTLTEHLRQKKKSFQAALKSGVTIGMGGDVGVYSHGTNAREMELMVEYGMKPIDVLRSATSVNASIFGYANKLGRIRKGLLADIVIVDGDPSVNISDARKVRMVMKDGVFYKR